jgi:hypothetical protein
MLVLLTILLVIIFLFLNFYFCGHHAIILNAIFINRIVIFILLNNRNYVIKRQQIYSNLSNITHEVDQIIFDKMKQTNDQNSD